MQYAILGGENKRTRSPLQGYKKAHDRKSRKLSEIDVGQSVFLQHTEGQNTKVNQ